MKFLKNWTIDLEKIPSYTAFKTEFSLDVDYQILDLIANSDIEEYTLDRKKLLIPLLNAIDKTTNTLKIKHNNRFDMGRFYPNNSISPICVSRHIKHTLFHYMNWVDLDMVKGHPSILYHIAKNNGIILPTFARYLREPDVVLNEMVEFYSCNDEMEMPLTKDDVKGIFNIKIYGGTHKTWVEQMGKEGKEIGTNNISPFEIEFEKECRILIDIVYLNNPKIAEKVKGDLNNEYKLKNKVMSYFCGTIENDILFICYKFLLKKGLILEKKCALEYDGLCFKNPISPTLEDDITELNYKIKTDTKLDVKMTLKKYNQYYIHSDIIEKREYLALPVAIAIPFEGVISTDTAELKTGWDFYDSWKETFELTHFKVINKSFFIKYIKDEFGFIEEFKVFTKSDIIISYEHITFETCNDSGIKVINSCIKEWLGDKNMRTYEDMKILPHPLACPENIFNLWSPFYADTLNEKYIWDFKDTTSGVKDDLISKCETVINHLKILCDHNETDFIYLQRWIGQMLKFPALKTTCITFISEEGAGKGTLLYLLSRIMGEVKVFETTEPDKYVWGSFNGLMKDCFLVNCNELELKAQQEAEGKIKGLITDGPFTINEKNIKAFRLKSFHRFMMTTNKEVPIKTHNKDRRNKIIRCSDEKCNDKMYFDTLRSYINDDRVLLMVYMYFMNLPNLATFHLETIEQNSYQKTIATSFNKSIPELFMEDFVCQNHDLPFVELLASEMLELFKKFKTKNDFIYECDSRKLMRNIQLLKLPENSILHRHTMKGNKSEYNIGLLKTCFKLDNLED